jgi:hypothetical protein
LDDHGTGDEDCEKIFNSLQICSDGEDNDGDGFTDLDDIGTTGIEQCGMFGFPLVGSLPEPEPEPQPDTEPPEDEEPPSDLPDIPEEEQMIPAPEEQPTEEEPTEEEPTEEEEQE